jgi:predicted dehydrogenase
MTQCRATKANKERCTLTVEPPNTYCWHHSPERAETRRRAAAKGGSSKPNREVRGYKEEVRDLVAEVKNGGQDRADAAVMLQGYRVLKDLVELERKVKETDELANRIEELEQAQEGGKRWRA